MAGIGGATMNDEIMLEQQLSKLGQELSGTTDLGETIMRRVRNEGHPSPQSTGGPMKKNRWFNWQALATLAACLCICVAIWSVARPQPLYARMMAALAKAKTVHGTGWTRIVPRNWPLEKLSADGNAATKKHEAEIWHWTDSNGVPCSFEHIGPVTTVRRGGEIKEYQQDADLTYVLVGGYSKDRIEKLKSLTADFDAFERQGVKKVDLGTVEENGRTLRGVRLVEGSSFDEVWIDTRTDLPARLKRVRLGEPIMDIRYTINEPVPEVIASYEPPKAKNIRGGTVDERRQAWVGHVADIEQQLMAKPMAGRVAVLPRPDGRTFDLQYPLRTPGGRYWVVPLDISENVKMTAADFVRLRATADGERRAGTWRLEVPQSLLEKEISRADLVYEDGVPWQEWVQFALGQFGLEFSDVPEERTIWIARQDGRQLKNWHEVKPPVPYLVKNGVEQKGVVRPGVGHILRPVTMGELLDELNQLAGQADVAWIIDKTGLPRPPKYDEHKHGTYMEFYKKVIEPKYLVATDAPYFKGDKSLEMARTWYEKEFGITFHPKRQMVTTHVVRRKDKQ
jgi:hypothetical protein